MSREQSRREPKYMTIEEVAELFRVEVMTVRYWLRRRRGPRSIKIEGRRLFPTAEVRKYEENPEEYQRQRDYELTG